MDDRQFFDALRIRANRVVREAERMLDLHPNNTDGTMAAHVARERLIKMRDVARKLNALADLADTA